MATWSEIQRTRLSGEEQLLSGSIPGFSFQDRAKAEVTTIRGNYTTTHNKTYSLCVWLKENYPYEMPSLYITAPCPLYGHNGKTIQNYGTSHTMHVWTPDWNNYVKICHTKSEYWAASDTIVGIIMKGFLWLEAFDVHCKTGKSIDTLSLTYS